MANKLRILFTVLPILAMLAASTTFIKSLFYDFHNDTVPFFGFIISLTIALLCILIDGSAVACTAASVKSDKRRTQLGCLGIVFLTQLAFSAICAICSRSKLNIIIIYFLITTALLALAAVFCRLGSDPKGGSV